VYGGLEASRPQFKTPQVESLRGERQEFYYRRLLPHLEKSTLAQKALAKDSEEKRLLDVFSWGKKSRAARGKTRATQTGSTIKADRARREVRKKSRK